MSKQHVSLFPQHLVFLCCLDTGRGGRGYLILLRGCGGSALLSCMVILSSRRGNKPLQHCFIQTSSLTNFVMIDDLETSFE